MSTRDAGVRHSSNRARATGLNNRQNEWRVIIRANYHRGQQCNGAVSQRQLGGKYRKLLHFDWNDSLGIAGCIRRALSKSKSRSSNLVQRFYEAPYSVPIARAWLRYRPRRESRRSDV